MNSEERKFGTRILNKNVKNIDEYPETFPKRPNKTASEEKKAPNQKKGKKK